MVREYFYSLNFVGRRHDFIFDVLLFFVIFFSIVGFLSIRGLTNKCFFVLLVFSVFFLKKSIVFIINNIKLFPIKEFFAVVVTLGLPTIAVFLNHLVIADWAYRYFDGPTRMFYSIFIMLFFIYKKINYKKVIAFSSPVAIFFVCFVMLSGLDVIENEGGRFSTYFVRPNSFGCYSAVLAGFCLFNIRLGLHSSRFYIAYQLTGFLVGFILVIGSQTRASWIALCISILVWMFFNYQQMTKVFVKNSIFVFSILLLFVLFLFPNSIDRFLSGLLEVKNWVVGTNIDTSTGVRFSMWKMAWQLFLHNPLFGYGDNGYVVYLEKPWFSSTASDLAKQIMACCGPHNELLANMLRSGILGGLSVLCLFFVPLVLFFKYAFDNNSRIAATSRLGISYIITVMICSISIEVFNLKYTSTFYGLTIAGLFAQIFSEKISMLQTGNIK